MLPLLLLSTSALGTTFQEQQPAPTFQASISLVHVDAEVLDRNGRVLTGCAKDDFRVFDEGQEQPIAVFAGYEEPLDLILLIDISGSMRHQVEK